MIDQGQKERILAVLFGGRDRTADDERWAWYGVLHIVRALYDHKRPRKCTGKRGRPKGTAKLPVVIARSLFTLWRTYSGEPPKNWRWGDKSGGNGFPRFLALVLEAAGREFVIHPETLLRVIRAERKILHSAYKEQGFVGWSPLDPEWRSAREKFAHLIRE